MIDYALDGARHAYGSGLYRNHFRSILARKVAAFLSETGVSEDRTCRPLYQGDIVLESCRVDHMLVFKLYMSEVTYP